MSRTINAVLLALTGLIAMSGFGCLWPNRQGREMVFDELVLSIKAISHEGDKNQNQWQTICDLLNMYTTLDCRNVTRTNCQQVGSIRVCDYESIVLTFDPPLSMASLKRLHGELLALKADGVTLGLHNSSLSAGYLGLAAEGSISVKVKIVVSPGATLYVERRWEGICEPVTITDNVFHDEISLRKGQEWVFYRTELATGKDTVHRYFRLNIMSKREQELTKEEFNRLIARP